MQDRIPVNPGRVLISPENGSAYYATITRADNATQEGTPLNKNSLLRDKTASLFGLGAAAVPDDVFGVLSRLQNGLGNEYVWAKYGLHEQITVAETTSEVTRAVNGYGELFAYSDEVYMVDGVLMLKNPVSDAGASSGNLPDRIIGKYLQFNGGAIEFVRAVTYAASGNITYTYSLVTGEIVYGLVGYVNSPDPNAYPVNDGYTYTALGQIGNKVQIATGSYKGTGSYGSGSKNSLTFDFVPQMVVIVAEGANSPYAGTIFAQGQSVSNFFGVPNDTSKTVTLTWSGSSVLWYATSADRQLNMSGKVYYYYAIG